MKIVHVIPGSGGTFYCENCVRDASVVKALRGRGHDVIMVPMYLPLFGHDESEIGDSPLFFGGVNAYLQQHVGLFRMTPRWIDRIFDSNWILKKAASMAGSTRASGLEEMTLSMLRGEDGNQVKEVRRLIDWLNEEVKPDVVHLSNALLMGLAPALRHRTGAAVVCTLQDEAPWIETMREPWLAKVWSAMEELAASVDGFIPVSNAYADEMRRRFPLESKRFHVVHTGIDLNDYPESIPDRSAPVLGYMARMSEASGLGDLAEAFLRIKGDPALAELRFRITGGSTHDDDGFLSSLRQRLADQVQTEYVDFIDDFELESRREFLGSLSVFSVPGVDQTAFGLSVLEALASGVPVVQPDVGAFSELVGITGGGVLYDPEDPEGLSRELSALLKDSERTRELGGRAREGVERHFSLDGMTRQYLRVYETALVHRKQEVTD